MPHSKDSRFCPTFHFSQKKCIHTIYPETETEHYNFLPFIWQFVPYKSLSVAWLESEPVMMLSAGIFYMMIRSKGSCVSVQRAQSGEGDE